MDPGLSTVTLQVEGGDSTPLELQSGQSRNVLLAAMPTSPDPGEGTTTSWEVAFRVVSRDGHPVAGAVRFVVRNRALPAPDKSSSAGEIASEEPSDQRTSARRETWPLVAVAVGALLAARPRRRHGDAAGAPGHRYMSALTRRAGASTLLVAPVLMALVALVATGLTGGLSPLGIEGLPEPGALTRVGLPIVLVVRDLAAMTTVGTLVLAATCVPPAIGTKEHALGPARRRLVACAQLAATVWAVGQPHPHRAGLLRRVRKRRRRPRLRQPSGLLRVRVRARQVRTLGCSPRRTGRHRVCSRHSRRRSGHRRAPVRRCALANGADRARGRHPQPRRSRQPAALPPHRHQRLARRTHRARAGGSSPGRITRGDGAPLLRAGRRVPGHGDGVGSPGGVAPAPLGVCGAVALRCHPGVEGCRRGDAGGGRLVAPKPHHRRDGARLGARLPAPRRGRTGGPAGRCWPWSRAQPHRPTCAAAGTAAPHVGRVTAGEPPPGPPRRRRGGSRRGTSTRSSCPSESQASSATCGPSGACVGAGTPGRGCAQRRGWWAACSSCGPRTVLRASTVACCSACTWSST